MDAHGVNGGVGSSGPDAERLPVPRCRCVRAPVGWAVASCCLLLAASLLGVPSAAAAQEASSAANSSPRSGTRATFLGQNRARALLEADAPGILTAAEGTIAAGTARPGSGTIVPGSSPSSGEGADRSAPGLFREVSTLERGWRLVGGGGLLASRPGSAGGPESETWAPGDREAEDEEDGEPPFLVRLFDARDVMLWIRDAREWGQEARRVLFGPRGLVRAGSVPGSERPRVRLELTDARPGARVVILTR